MTLFIERTTKDQGIVVVTPNGEELRMYITEIKGSRVKFAFTKFQGFNVWRGELYNRMQQEKRDAQKMEK